MLEITLIVVASLMLAWPLGIYMAGIFSAQPHASDRFFYLSRKRFIAF